jgi:SAM-dependent methyltransferase
MAKRAAGPSIRAAAGLRNRRIEQRYGLPREASGIVWLDELGYAGHDRNSYAPTPWGLLQRMLPLEDVGSDDVFLDLGCGMGRVLLEAGMNYPFARVEGVELVPSLADTARAVLRRNESLLQCGAWDVVTSDVLNYSVPDDVTVGYLYDPFTGSVFDAAMARLEASVERHPRRLRVVYVTPQESERLARSAVEARGGSFRVLAVGATLRYVVCDLGPR